MHAWRSITAHFRSYYNQNGSYHADTALAAELIRHGSVWLWLGSVALTLYTQTGLNRTSTVFKSFVKRLLVYSDFPRCPQSGEEYGDPVNGPVFVHCECAYKQNLKMAGPNSLIISVQSQGMTNKIDGVCIQPKLFKRCNHRRFRMQTCESSIHIHIQWVITRV